MLHQLWIFSPDGSEKHENQKQQIFVGFLERPQGATKKPYKNVVFGADLKRTAGKCFSKKRILIVTQL